MLVEHILGLFWDYLTVHTPWWVWVAAGVAGSLALWRFIGTRATLGLIALVLVFGALMKGRQDGYALAVKREQQALDRRKQKRLKINERVAGRTPEENRERLRKWVIPEGAEQ